MSIVELISGQPDLYKALRQYAAQLSADPVVELESVLATILTTLRAGDAVAQTTAARLSSVDQGVFFRVRVCPLTPSFSLQVVLAKKKFSLSGSSSFSYTASTLNIVPYTGLLLAVMRRGCGLTATRHETAVRAYLAMVEPAAVFVPALATSATRALPMSTPGMPLCSDRSFETWFTALGVPYGLGLYGEARSIYTSEHFADKCSPEPRTVHLGIDVFAAKMTPVHAPLAGRVRFVTYNADPLDYGWTLIVEHDLPDRSAVFYTLYGHLAATLPTLCQVGQEVQPGQLIAHLGDWHENGGWSAHLHFQVMTDLWEQQAGNFFGVGHGSLWDVWSSVCIDPNAILRIPSERFL
jgi:hypothetical protein